MISLRHANRNRFAPGLIAAACFALAVMPALAEPPAVDIADKDGRMTLTVDGQPFYIKGAGGDASKELLAASGANTFRTWGVDDSTAALLDEAQKHGLKVVLGIWFGHERHGFDYADADQVAEQYNKVKDAVTKFKDHPAVLAWALGNEHEGYDAGDNAAIWSHVQACAALVKKLDPSRPTMTVIAEIGGNRISAIHKLCPDIDIIGINSYGGVMTIPKRYKAAGGTKPYVVTEFGPPGPWETSRTNFGSAPEMTSTQKAAVYTKAYDILKADPMCLGSFAFTWGFKQEATATWFGMFLPNGQKAGAVDAMTKAWSGKDVENFCPTVEPLKLSSDSVDPGQTITVKLDAADPEGAALKVNWILKAEAENYFTGGDYQATPPSFPEAITDASATGATLTMPQDPGKYRIYAFVTDGHGGAMANAPLLVKGEDKGPKGLAGKLPHVVFGEPGTSPSFIPSGYMGEAEFIKVDENSHLDPKDGNTCMKVTYEKTSGWGGVVWQHPVNDWGDKPGGFNLTGATKLTFHARGEKGGETAKFGFGVLGNDKKYSDSATAETAITLTKEWKQYTIDLEGKDLTRIKTGFFWSIASTGEPITFFLDNIRYE